MKSTITFVSAGLLILLIGISLFYFFNKTQTELENAYLVSPVYQQVKERIWKEIEFRLEGKDYSLLNPNLIVDGADNTFFIVDSGDMKIYKYDFEGNKLQSYGKGIGRGPGEFLNIIDLEIGIGQMIWALDSELLRITIFQGNGEFNIHNIKERAFRFMPVKTDEVLLKTWYQSNPYISNLDGNLILRFQPLVNNTRLWSHIVSGNFDADEKGIIRVNFRTGNMIRYNKKGDIKWFRRPVDPVDMLTLTNNIQEFQKQGDTDLFVHTYKLFADTPFYDSPSVINNQAHVLIAEQTDSLINRYPEGDHMYFAREFVDVYDYESGTYKFSYKLPENLSTLTLNDQYLAGTLQDTAGIAIWKYENF